MGFKLLFFGSNKYIQQKFFVLYLIITNFFDKI